MPYVHMLILNFCLLNVFRLREIEGEEDLDEDEIYMKRLSGGLFTLQLVKDSLFTPTNQPTSIITVWSLSRHHLWVFSAV